MVKNADNGAAYSDVYAMLIAETLKNDDKYRNLITKDYLTNLEQAAPVHDIGKVGITDAILQKPGKLTDDEYEKIIFAKIKLIHPSRKRQEKNEPRKTISCIIVGKDTREENRSGNSSGNL